jgi:hypothetical protein
MPEDSFKGFVKKLPADYWWVMDMNRHLERSA